MSRMHEGNHITRNGNGIPRVAVAVLSVTLMAVCIVFVTLSGSNENVPPSSVLSAKPALSPAQYVTAKGCRCKSPCGASIDSYYRCDWCYTEGSCGSWSATFRTWDYCKYAPPMSNFEAQDHKEKEDQLWERMTDTANVGKSAEPKGALSVLKQMVSESMITTFEDQWEVLPKGRSKVIHTQGVHCRFKLDVTGDSQFTGLLSKGTQTGIIRMGAAQSLDGSFPAPKMFPGIGIKFLRSGVKSANFVALRSTGPGGSWNFFDSEITNHVAPPAALLKLNKFQQASGCVDMVGLSDVCKFNQEGQSVSQPVFPFELEFVATAAAKAASSPHQKKNNELLKELSAIPAGTTLFEVYTYASPADKLAGKKALLGSLSTTSQCVQSLFGDNQMYFRHQRMEEDFALAPEWIKQMPALKDPACKATAGPVSQWQCPVKDLMK